jgi:hypothetical protein
MSWPSKTSESAVTIDGQYFALFHAQVQPIHDRYGLGIAEAHVEVVDIQK